MMNIEYFALVFLLIGGGCAFGFMVYCAVLKYIRDVNSDAFDVMYLGVIVMIAAIVHIITNYVAFYGAEMNPESVHYNEPLHRFAQWCFIVFNLIGGLATAKRLWLALRSYSENGIFAFAFRGLCLLLVLGCGLSCVFYTWALYPSSIASAALIFGIANPAIFKRLFDWIDSKLRKYEGD